MNNQVARFTNHVSLLKSWPGILLFAALFLVIAVAVSGLLRLNRQNISPNNNQPTPPISAAPTLEPTPIPTLSPTPNPSPTPSPSLTPAPTNAPVLPTHIPLQPEIAWGNRSYNQVIFTFDAGSGNQSIDSILNTLAAYKVEGAFFITGSWAEKYPQDLKRIAANGHAIYNHTYSHPHLIQASDAQIREELQHADRLIKSLVGFDSKPYFRAPYGERDPRVLAIAANQGYRHVYWTIDAWDWKEGVTTQQVKDRILNNLQPGTIYLMHVGDGITGQILPEMFQEIRNRGYIINSLRQGVE